MARACRLAKGGWGRTWPNPLVGAVVMHGDAEVGAGWHAEYGDPHAEVVALEQAGSRANGATLYTTLEPCVHTGKQPPCVPAIIAAGIARVVVAVRDPNPVAHGGIDQLRAAGIVVEVGVLAEAVARGNFRFLHRFERPGRPFVAIKLAVSMDGFIADAAGRSRWVSSEAARDWVHWLRAGFGALGVGGDTAIMDGARLTTRGSVVPRIPPRRVIFDRGGQLRAGHPIFDTRDSAPITIVVGTAVPEAIRDELIGAGAEVLVAGGPAEALSQLASGGVDSILVEGGGRLAGALLRAGLVDRVYQIQCPLWLGGGTPAWHGLERTPLDEAARWQLADAFAPGPEGDMVIELQPR